MPTWRAHRDEPNRAPAQDPQDGEPRQRSRDPILDVAIARLQELFDHNPARLFYSTQIETSFEREFFHWITGRGLLELARAAAVRRRATVIAGRAGFKAEGRDTSSWGGVTWTETNHNLDRIYTCDGTAYGTEIKNTQNYISREELRTKLKIAGHLGVVPLFIMRFAPKSYIHDVNQAGGFVLLFEEQMYPWGHSSLLQDVRSILGLKVASPRDVKDGDILRFVRWHERRARRD